MFYLRAQSYRSSTRANNRNVL